MGVEIRGLRPEVVAEGNEVSVHYRSRTNVGRGLFMRTKTDYAYNGSEGEATLRTRTATREGPRCENEVTQEKGGGLAKGTFQDEFNKGKRLRLELRYI